MKKIFTYSASIMALTLLLTWATGCSKDDDANPQDSIKKTWSLGAAGFVKQDGTDVTAEYSGLTMTFKADGTYTTSNAKKLFFPNGTWAWQGTGTSTIVLDGDFTVAIKELTNNTLRVEFAMDEDHVNPNGKTGAVVGNYEILFTAN